MRLHRASAIATALVLVACTPGPAGTEICAPAAPTAAPTALGSDPLAIGETFTIDSHVLAETRRINVLVPTSYGEAIDAPLPVLYMPDGGTGEDFLHVAGLVQVSVSSGTMRPFMLVGIENTERRRDMTGPTMNAEDLAIAPLPNGDALVTERGRALRLVRGIGGDFCSYSTLNVTPGTICFSNSFRISVVTRSSASCVKARASKRRLAWSGTMFRSRPPSTTPTFTETPLLKSFRFCSAIIWCAIARRRAMPRTIPASRCGRRRSRRWRPRLRQSRRSWPRCRRPLASIWSRIDAVSATSRARLVSAR